MMMKLKHRHLAVLALLVTSITLPAIASAQSTPPMMATYVCRPAVSGETPNAKMIASSTGLVCKPFAVRLHMGHGSMKVIGSVVAKPAAGPNFANALTPAQYEAAYNTWIEQTMHIDPATEHTP